MSTSETRLRNTLIELGCDNTAFCAISGVSMARLSTAFRGSRDFSQNELGNLNRLVAEMGQLVADAHPFPINFRNIRAVQSLLECRRSGIVWKARAVEEQ
jgi:hypothetical protein